MRSASSPRPNARVSALRPAAPAGFGGRAHRARLGLGLARGERRGLADEALARHDGLTGLARATDLELQAIPGVGSARAAQLAAAFELGRRLMADWPAGRWTVRSPGDVADRLILQMGRLEREELRVVMLNTKNVVLRVPTVYQGNVARASSGSASCSARPSGSTPAGSSSSTTTRAAIRPRARTTST